MTTAEIQDALLNLIENAVCARETIDEGDDPDISDLADIASDIAENAQGFETVTTFEAAGLLTRNEGLVLRLADGGEFQVTIVQSRLGENDD
ncbi:hypothetical protein PHYC_02022 [Phycisphaerales bacterium]|nr:hypothetical protein PHYC_02022 [Phycisphaerales bacterium]